MKTCGYCGHESPDQALNCCECGEAFRKETAPDSRLSPKEWLNQPVSATVKGYFVCGAWGMVILATLALKPAYLLTAPAFPLGLLALFPNGESKAVIGWITGIPLFIGWGIYGLLFWTISRTSKKGTFFLIYLILCAILALNIAGCKRSLDAAARIQ